jgi:peptide deformylase
MGLRKIMRYDKDDILKMKSKTVEKTDKEISTLLKDMADTMYSANAFGLSAVQIGVLKRVVVLKDETGLIKLINPVIIKTSGEQQVMEGCLSIPGIYGKVKRPDMVIVMAFNDCGEAIFMEGKGSLARAVCHEIDHLDGVLFIDKIIPGTLVNYNYF